MYHNSSQKNVVVYFYAIHKRILSVFEHQMSQFNYKPDKLKDRTTTRTLDGTHKSYVKTFEDSRTTIEQKKQRLHDIELELAQLNVPKTSVCRRTKKNAHNTDSIPGAETSESSDDPLDADSIRKRATLKGEHTKLSNEISDIEHNVSELDYYSKIDNVLLEYYDILDNTCKDDVIPLSHKVIIHTPVINQTSRKRARAPQQNILCFFVGKQSAQTDTTQDDTTSAQCDTCSKQEPVVTQSEHLPKNRAYLHDQYARALNRGSDTPSKYRSNNSNFCEKCGVERILIQSDGVYVCSKCGETEEAIIESDIPNYKDSVQEKTIYPYKRSNHFVEWLNQFQAKETTDIPKEVYDTILTEIKRARIDEPQKLTIPEMKVILKKLKLHQYYEHIPHIICKITGKRPPFLSRETEDKIKQMFREIQEPFAKYCPHDRTNFLNYAYVFHKLFQILGMNEFVPYFPLLKSREKLRLLDKIWKQICGDLGWEFFPSL